MEYSGDLPLLRPVRKGNGLTTATGILAQNRGCCRSGRMHASRPSAASAPSPRPYPAWYAWKPGLFRHLRMIRPGFRRSFRNASQVCARLGSPASLHIWKRTYAALPESFPENGQRRGAAARGQCLLRRFRTVSADIRAPAFPDGSKGRSGGSCVVRPDVLSTPCLTFCPAVCYAVDDEWSSIRYLPAQGDAWNTVQRNKPRRS